MMCFKVCSYMGRCICSYKGYRIEGQDTRSVCYFWCFAWRDDLESCWQSKQHSTKYNCLQQKAKLLLEWLLKHCKVSNVRPIWTIVNQFASSHDPGSIKDQENLKTEPLIFYEEYYRQHYFEAVDLLIIDWRSIQSTWVQNLFHPEISTTEGM